ncbi:hypothetical protein A6302_04517 [Methylobrevis pamukkalensis]|uniref:Uncharacterized protein n=1 Tax=Methylobrevis pamukkalensis TaxID=1439726 RepID=A0A1E3GNF1_9HYPH|nr:hypothetical protein A6302_04517 [Methylobrevis pamukkalensis]
MFLLQLADALGELRLLAVAHAAAKLEQAAFAAHDLRDLGQVLAGLDLGRKHDLGQVVALGLEPGAAGGQLVEPLHHDRQPRHGLRVSSRASSCPASTFWPLRTSSSPMMPPVGCWTFLT